MKSPYHTLHSVKPSPADDGSFDVIFTPDVVDPGELYGMQLMRDRFTPSSQSTERGGIVYVDGVIGDPEGSETATLAIDRLAQARNARARRQALRLGGAAAHEPEGTLWPHQNQ